DGCSADCNKEPSCGWNQAQTDYSCFNVCGDGMRFPGEACDDGNTVSGDGCSADCTVVEEGYTCTDQTVTDTVPCSDDEAASCLVLPIVYRDFRGHDGNSCGSTPLQTIPHPHFGITPPTASGDVYPGMVANNIGI